MSQHPSAVSQWTWSESQRRLVCMTGILYLLVALIAPINTIWLPSAYYVAGDAVQTATNIVSGEFVYRLAMASGLIAAILFLGVVLQLYRLLVAVDEHLARVMLVLVVVGMGATLFGLICQVAPLVLLGQSDALLAMPLEQRQVLASVFFRLYSASGLVGAVFWGLWLYPCGRLVMKSGFIPRWLGVLLIIGCFAYAGIGLIGLVVPSALQTANLVAMPFYAVGELAFIGWLLLKGWARSPRKPMALGSSTSD